MKKLLFLGLFITLLSFSNNPYNLESKSIESIKLITWNIQDLGQSKNNEEIAFIAKTLNDFDVVAIQEVVAKHPGGAQKIAQIADELNRKGSKWDYRISNPTKSPSAYMSERYAFLWKTSKVSLKGRAFLDSELESQIIREPFIAEFKAKHKDSTFFVVNFHSRKHNDLPELEIVLFKEYQKRLNSDKIIISGDFYLNEEHSVWNDFYDQGYSSAVKNSKTTLKRKCKSGDYLSHAIDNIYYSKQISFINSRVVDYIKTCENLATARLISDHLPVALEFSL
ncbi:endonuclease/exonuclease/phosphatase family protein [uncultured Winogradskyella sp.]|uniref:endonuclease/exonuclease/phosphatase family protein n=1 Tax=uncultured Winogradskyella sp. TaxID=395353 RepID=UPI0026061DFD|nr:endonuclease/exonuclease/phosphatase family protein [uncultured Winogradskyella sp.]